MKYYNLYKLHEQYNKHEFDEEGRCSCKLKSGRLKSINYVYVEYADSEDKEWQKDYELYLNDLIKEGKLDRDELIPIFENMKIHKHIPENECLKYMMYNIDQDVKVEGVYEDLNKIRKLEEGGKYDWVVRSLKRFK